MSSAPEPGASAGSDLSRCWREFERAVENSHHFLAKEVWEAWNEFRLVLREESECWAERIHTTVPVESLEDWIAERNRLGELLLRSPAVRLLRRRPLTRILQALDRNREELRQSSILLPDSVRLSGPDLLAVIRGPRLGGLSKMVLLGSRGVREVSIRGVISSDLAIAAEELFRRDERLVEAVWEVARHLRALWDIVRTSLDFWVATPGQEVPRAVGSFMEWRRQIPKLENGVDEAIRAYNDGAANLLRRLSLRLARSLVMPRRSPRRGSQTSFQAPERWARVLRSMEADALLELDLEGFERQFLAGVLGIVEDLDRELRNVEEDVDFTLDWLRLEHAALSRTDLGEYERRRTTVPPAESHLRDFEVRVERAAQVLPDVSEAVPRLVRRFRTPYSFRRLRPRETFRECFLRSARGKFSRILTSEVDAHRDLASYVGRARMVFDYARSSLETGQLDAGGAIEAVRNARLALEFRRDLPTERPPTRLEMGQAAAALLLENRFLLRRHRLGLMTYLTRQGTRRTATILIGLLRIALERAHHRAGWSFQTSSSLFLGYLGWKPASSQGKTEVVRRPMLPHEFTVDLSRKDLPGIYRHLFRFEPVRDPRFLVGRDREIRAIGEARELWEQGRPVSVLLVGERGSGKTSLINCAILQCLQGVELVRGEFGRRLLTASQLREFLAGVLGIDDPSRIEETLRSSRRAVILEELERCYLRRIGGFGAIRELERLISATCATTLWILATNELAYQVLDACTDLGSFFSHRIQAGTASKEDLRDAILLRHHLSGLRLQFPAATRNRGRVGRLADRAAGERSPEQSFFSTLSSESAGSYRAAFDIWLGQIDGVEEGVLYLKPIAFPDVHLLVQELSLEEFFLLAAVQHHGGLTVAEHARTTLGGMRESHRLFEGLLAREVIEPEPNRPGFRIRPEANRVVREGLYRRNLVR